MNALISLAQDRGRGSPIVPRTPHVRIAPERDERWPAIVAELERLFEAHRRSVRIVDADCGDGALLLHALRHARALGFVAIEGHGIDGVPALVARARHAAARLHDPAIGVDFEMADLADALAQEAEVPADIVLWHGSEDHLQADASVVRALAAAGRMVIDHALFTRVPARV